MVTVNHKLLVDVIYWVTRTRWLFIAFIVGGLLLLLPTPPGLAIEGYRLLVIILVTLILIIKEPIPLPAVAFLVIVLQVYLGISSANEVAQAFMSDAVFFIMGSLMLAVAIIHQGWDARIALGITILTGNKTIWLTLGLIVLSAILASFIGQHTVVALMLPIAMSLIRFTNPDTKKVANLAALLLFSIAYGSIIGSMGTPSGGGRNAIMLGYWKEFGAPTVTYLDWMVHVYPLVLIQIPFLLLVLWKSYRPEVMRLDSGLRKLRVQVGRAGKITYQDILSASIFFLVFLGWVFFSDTLGLGIIALSGVILYLATGLIRWEVMARHVNWGVVLLFGAMISLGVQIKNTGAAFWVAQKIIYVFGSSIESLSIISDILVLTITGLFANVVSSSATVAVLGPVNLNLPGDALHLGYMTAIASAFGFLTVAAAPACTIIYASGLLKGRDFLRAGWKMGVLTLLITLVYVNTYWRVLSW